MRHVKLADVIEINPGKPSNLAPNDEIAFVAMADVSEEGLLKSPSVRTYSEVSTGYTPFSRGDVLLAKITPCFENGKSCLTHSLSKEYGFGSTEFHVLRPTPFIDPGYLHHLVRSKEFRSRGERRMTGSAGQRRVPAEFLRNFDFALPIIEEQARIANLLDTAQAIIWKRTEALVLVDDFIRSVFLDMFGDPAMNTKGWPVGEMGSICEFYAGNTLPKGEQFTGQEHGVLLLKVGDMNLADNEEVISVSREWSESGNRGIVAPPGSVLVPKRGGAIATNKKRVLSRSCALDPNLMAIFPKAPLNTDYLFAWFNLFNLATITSGSAVPQLNKGDLAPLTIQIPPSSVLDKFSATVQRVKKISANLKVQKKHADILFSVLQQSSFA